jgi:hypothetical protein
MFEVTFPLFVVTRQSSVTPEAHEPASHIKLIAVPDSNHVWHAALFSSEAAAERFIAQTANPHEHDTLAVRLDELVLVLRELAAQQVERVVLDPGTPQAPAGTLADLLESLTGSSG